MLSIQPYKAGCCDQVAAVKGHCVGKQRKFRKGMKKDQMHFNTSLLDLSLSKLSIMKWLQLARECWLLIFFIQWQTSTNCITGSAALILYSFLLVY